LPFSRTTPPPTPPCPGWRVHAGLAAAPASLLLPSLCSLRDPELVALLCRAGELWCPGTPVWPCAAQGGRQFRLDAISTTESTVICPASSTAPLQSTYLLVGSSGPPVPLDQWSFHKESFISHSDSYTVPGDPPASPGCSRFLSRTASAISPTAAGAAPHSSVQDQ